MPCDTQLAEGQTLVQRMSEIDQALKRLETYLSSGQVSITIGPNGAVSFTGWQDGTARRISDVCAYRSLAASNSWALRQAQARAEMMQGRKVNARAVAAGTHSHDGGRTWHGGH